MYFTKWRTAVIYNLLTDIFPHCNWNISIKYQSILYVHVWDSCFKTLVSTFCEFRDLSVLETYFFSHSQTFASGFNLNSQIAVSNSQLVFPTFEQYLTLRCGMAIVSWGWNLVHHSPLRWQRTCWRPYSSFLLLKKYIIFSAIAVTWQDSESVLQGALTFPLPLLYTC